MSSWLAGKAFAGRAAFLLVGALIRHGFVARHKALVHGKRVPWEHVAVRRLALVGMAFWLAPPPSAQAKAAAAYP